jgi:hypothetical protein
LPILDADNFAVKNVHAVVIPEVAEAQSGACVGLVAELVYAAGVADFSAVSEAFSDAEGLNVANDRLGTHKVEADGGVRKHVALFRFNDGGGGRQEASGLAFQRQVLGADLPGDKQGDREKSADGEFVKDAKIHFVLTPVECSRLPPGTLGNSSSFNTAEVESSAIKFRW